MTIPKIYEGFLEGLTDEQQKETELSLLNTIKKEKVKRNNEFYKRQVKKFSPEEQDYILTLVNKVTKNKRKITRWLLNHSPVIINHLMNNVNEFKKLELNELDKEFFQLMETPVGHGVRGIYQGIPGVFRDHYGEYSGRNLRKYYTTNLFEATDIYIGGKSTYFSPNTFKTHSGKRDDLIGIKSIFIDLDFSRSEKDEKINDGFLPIDYRLYRMNIALKETNLPYPTVVTDSGSGLHLYWIFENMLMDNTTDKRWNNTAKSLTEEILYRLRTYDEYLINKNEQTLRVYPDMTVTNPNGQMRIPGSLTKNRDVCHAIKVNNTQLYPNFHLLAKEIWHEYEFPEDYEGEYKPRKKKKKQRATISNIYVDKDDKEAVFWHKYNIERLRDFNTLLTLRDYDVIGYRNTYLFILGAQYMVSGTELESLLNINKKFNNPLPDREVNKLIYHLKNGDYMSWKAETICDKLDITNEEQKKLSVITEQNKRYIREINREEQKKLSERNKAFQQIVSGILIDVMTNKEIQELLNKSRSAVQRYRRKYNELTEDKKSKLYSSLTDEQKEFIQTAREDSI